MTETKKTCGAPTGGLTPCVREPGHQPPHQDHTRYVAFPDERVRVWERELEFAGPAQPSTKEREAYRKAAPLDAGETGEVSREPFLAKEHVDKLYEPLTDDEMNALLSAVRHFYHPRSPSLSAMSRAANKIEAQLHLSVTGHRIYEGP